MPNITAEEYRGAIEDAEGYIDNHVDCDCRDCRMARVLLALAGAWREVPEQYLTTEDWRGEDGGYGIADERTYKANIAARHGLTVDKE